MHSDEDGFARRVAEMEEAHQADLERLREELEEKLDEKRARREKCVFQRLIWICDCI